MQDKKRILGNTLTKQGGFGVGCFFLTVAFLVLVVLLAMLVAPVYLEDRKIEQSFENMMARSDIRTMPKYMMASEIRTGADFEGSDRIDFNRALTTRTVEGKREVRLAYEVAVPLFKGLSLLFDFEHLKRSQ